ncbi:MAG: phospho-sugar mutase [Gordonia sp. (in: high G+C Gram-positive bacteria)]
MTERARRWLAHDPDPATRAELAAVLAAAQAGAAAAVADLEARFAGPLTFGTAGLRGIVGAGESRMNVAVVSRVTAGLARYLRDVVGADARVVVGADARQGSAEFATATLEVLSGAGVTALALPPQLPTPVTAYAVRALDADAGIMITASHNPPADNGYKVYLGGRAVTAGRGVQIVPPADAEIAAHIDAAPPADALARTVEQVEYLGSGCVDAYVRRMAGHRRRTEPSPVRVVLTALHGVGGELARRVFAAAGVCDVHVVAEQFAPDPAFPTVAFPNPEEPGALDLSVALAEKVDADVVIALDPDADRCAVAVPGAGGWRQLTGDEVGALLGEQAATDSGRSGDALVCSIVSSGLLVRIAQAHGLRGCTTLTGFKWIARTPGIRYGYEEAIGYCTDPVAVADKDGIGAAVRVVTMIEELRAAGRTVDDELDRLARLHGLHATAQLGFRVGEVSAIADVMARLRADPPSAFAGSPVVAVDDLAAGGEELPPTDALRYRTAAGDRVIIRPSGTEPKLKCYLEVVLPCTDGDVPHAAAAARLTEIKADVTVALGL